MRVGLEVFQVAELDGLLVRRQVVQDSKQTAEGCIRCFCFGPGDWGDVLQRVRNKLLAGILARTLPYRPRKASMNEKGEA